MRTHSRQIPEFERDENWPIESGVVRLPGVSASPAPSAQRLRRLTNGALSLARRRILSSQRARTVAYAIKNRSAFGDLRQHDRMLADRVRTDAYWAGIQKHVAPGDVVVDLGTGTGVLALFAARAGASRVHAIEHGPMAEVAEAVVLDNRVHTVEVHRLHSRSFQLPERVDAIVHEQIGEAMFDERVVENIAELRDRVLKPGGMILPARLQLCIEPVQLTDAARLPFASQQQLHGIDFRALEPYAAQQPPAYRYLVHRPFPLERFLSATREPAVSVDLHTAVASDLPSELSFEREVSADGILDGMVVYFNAGFDDELWFTSSPDAEPTSWGSPLLRIESRPVRAGDTIVFALRARQLVTPSSWEWTVTVRPRT